MAAVTRPLLLVVLGVLVGLEALGVSVFAVWYVVQFFVAPVESLVGALFLLGLFILFAVWLWVATIGLFRMRTAARAATLVWQTIQVVVGVSMINAEGDWVFVAISMIVLGLAAGVLLFTPSVVAVTARVSTSSTGD